MTFKSEEEAAAYLAGAIDADGCVYYGEGVYAKTGQKRIQRRIIFSVGDPELVDVVAAAYDMLDIKYMRSERPGQREGYKRRYTLEVTAGHGIRRFAEKVTLHHRGKKEKLQKCLDSFIMKGLCSGCGVPYDQETPGCENCRTRLRYRRRVRPNGLVRRVA